MLGVILKRFKKEENPISVVEGHLRVMGYDLSVYGAGVALAEMYSGYNDVEAAAHILPHQH